MVACLWGRLEAGGPGPADAAEVEGEVYGVEGEGSRGLVADVWGELEGPDGDTHDKGGHGELWVVEESDEQEIKVERDERTSRPWLR